MWYSTREPAGLGKLADLTEEIREFVDKDRPDDINPGERDPGTDGQFVAGNLASLLQRVAATSLQEIDDLITELQALRDKLQNDETRVRRAIVEYTTLSQSTLHSTKVISECLANWKQNSRRPERETIGADWARRE